jgi:hypothetical protein
MKTPQNELTLRFDKPIEMITLKELIPIQKNGKPAWKIGTSQKAQMEEYF